MSQHNPLDDLALRVGLLRIEDVMRITAFRSRQQVYDAVHRGELAAPVKIGSRASAWRARDVVSFVESRKPDPLFVIEKARRPSLAPRLNSGPTQDESRHLDQRDVGTFEPGL